MIYRELESSFINTKGSLWCNALSHTFVGVTKYLYESSESQIVSNIILGYFNILKGYFFQNCKFCIEFGPIVFSCVRSRPYSVEVCSFAES